MEVQAKSFLKKAVAGMSTTAPGAHKYDIQPALWDLGMKQLLLAEVLFKNAKAPAAPRVYKMPSVHLHSGISSCLQAEN